MMTNLLFSQLTAIGKRFAMVLTMLLMLGVTQVWGETIVATFSSDDVVTNSGYTVYESNDWYLSKGGNNVSGGYNAKNSTTIGGNTFGTSAKTSDYGFYIKSKTTLNNVSKITFTYTAGSGYSGAKIYLGYSTNGSNWNAVSLTSGTQGMSAGNLSTTYTMQFAAISSAYYAIIVSNGTTTGAFRLDNITATFYGTSGGGGSTPTQLAAPTGLTVDNITSSGATLSWDAVDNASSYVVTIVDGGSLKKDYPVTGITTTVSDLESSTDYLWTVTAVGDEINYTNSEESETGEFTTSAPAGGGGGDEECTWQLVTDVSDLAVGDEIVIAASGEDYALSTTQNSNNRSATAITKSNNTITFSEAVQIITLVQGSTTGTLSFLAGDGYLYAASSSKNYMRTSRTPGSDGDWVIGIDNTGVATIQAQGDNTNSVIRYNPNGGTPIFSCYASSSSTGSLPAIYKKVCTAKPTVYLIPKCGCDGGGTWLVVIEWFATF